MNARVWLVDDHEVVRRGVAEMLNDEDDLEVVGESGSVAEALAFVPPARPDVVVVDVRLPDGSGIELCRDLLSQVPGMRALVLTSFTDDEALLDAIVAGASGFVLKQVLGADLVSDVRAVAQGRSLLDDRAKAAVVQRLRRQREESDPLRMLTDQERAVLDLIGEGLTNKQIGQQMFLAEKTVKNYVSSLLSKLGMHRRTQAAVLATELRQNPKGEHGT